MALRPTFLALAASALLSAGCGASDDPGAPAPLPLGTGAAAQPLGSTGAVEKTDGRLGGATTAHPGGGLEELSPGGRLDVSPRAHGDRRDGVGAGASCADQTLAPAPATLGAMAAAQLCLLNGERADAGLPPLKLDALLSAAAQAYAADLVAGQYFSHTGRDGSTIRSRLDAAGYLPRNGGWAIGENLAWGTGALATPASIMQAWMNSPGHRENILNAEYREIGIGVVPGNPSTGSGAGATYANAFGVVDRPAGGHKPGSKPAKKSGKRRANRRKAAKKRAARKARLSSRGGKGGKVGKGKKRWRGPRARIAI
jgi:uncharacterized protein YkwD